MKQLSTLTDSPKLSLPSSNLQAVIRTAWRFLEETVLKNPYIDHSNGKFPSEKQAVFLSLPCLEALYGGAAGGGKSIALLAGALQFVDRPGYSALIVRRTYRDLAKPGALMDVAHSWLQGSGAEWSDREKAWRFPSSSSTVSFGYMESESDKYQYQSAEYQFVGFDELTQFSESQYEYLFSRLRRLKGVDIPIRMRAASNPGGFGHEWVKARFITSAGHGGRIFVPALLEDNPGLDKAEYEKALAQLDHITRKQLRHGDWDIRPEGNLFKREWFEILSELTADGSRCRFWDMGGTEGGGDPTVGCLVSRTKDGVYAIEDVRRGRWSPGNAEKIVLQTATIDGRRVKIRMEQEPGSSGKIVIALFTKLLAGFDFAGVPATGEKITRWQPLSAQAEAGNVKLVRGDWNRDFLEEICAVPQDGVHDDQADAAAGAFSELALHSRQGAGIYL